MLTYVILNLKSRSKVDDPDHLAIKARAKEMQRQEAEEIRQREANETALQAIGMPRKKQKTSVNSSLFNDHSSSFANNNSFANGSGSKADQFAADGSSNGFVNVGAAGSSESNTSKSSNRLFGSHNSKPVSVHLKENGSNSYTYSFSIQVARRIKRVSVRDVLYLMEQEKDTVRSLLLYKNYCR